MHSYLHKFLLGFLFSFFLLSLSVCSAEEKHAPQIACYQIDVKLDTQEKKLWGNETVTFINTSQKSVDTLFLHLYPNAFQSDTTILMKESLFPGRVKKKEKYRGFMKIEKMGTSSGLDLTDKKIIDETIMKLPLPFPLPPQGRIELEIEFMVKLPEIFIRMGYSGKDFMIAQWFPKMAVLEEDGNWNAYQYHFQSEFFADFGTYHVSITAPLNYVIGATGYLVEGHTNPDSTKTLVFHAKNVHDFAWAASPDYQISKRTLDGIEVSFYYKPEHKESVDRIMDYAEFALRHYNSSFGKYHYSHFTIVDTKIGLAGGAMEYPTLITISPSRLPPERIRADALVVFHEIAHQWWYGMVASNEFEEAWLDEGFAVYSERRALEKRFGKSANIIDLWGIKVSDLDHARFGNVLDLQSDPVVRNSWEFRNYLSYHCKVYFKASLVLETLRNYLGEEAMDELIKKYFQRYKFKHPKTRDFIQLVNEVTGEDLTFWFEQLLYGTGICDYEVTSIESIPIESKDKKRRYTNRVEVRRLGEVIIPVDVVIELEDGEKIKQIWDGKERWHKIEMETDSKIEAVLIDPENKITLDINVNNNSLTVRSSDSVMMKLSTQCLFWLETLMHWITCF
ncbi:MAG: M1 family metallopeptidase [candidate division Zixibacteria bacterium]|nr:M1 family metallopeptidase [candidate division Zixibacteria bacterium]